MNRTKLMAVSVIILMMAFGLMTGCQNNPMAPTEQSADTQVAYKTVQFPDEVKKISLTAEHFGLAKTIGLRSNYGRVYADYGGWLFAPGVVLHLPPDNDWEDRQILYFEVQVSDNPVELGMERDDDERSGKGNNGNKNGNGNHDDEIALKITLYDRHGEEVHINFDYSAWSNPDNLNDFYNLDKEDLDGGVAKLYVHKRYLQYLLGKKNYHHFLKNKRKGSNVNNPYWVHIDPDEDAPDMNTSTIESEYFSYMEYELPGFSRWGWIF